MTIQEIKDAIRGMTGSEAVSFLTEYIARNPEAPGLDEVYTLRGMKNWGMQNRKAAIDDYLAAIKLNPESKAVQALKATNDILDFYDKNLYNP